jgi:hypothetical protein
LEGGAKPLELAPLWSCCFFSIRILRSSILISAALVEDGGDPIDLLRPSNIVIVIDRIMISHELGKKI